MTNREIIKCAVCDALTLVRTQAGWLERFAIRFPCGHCGILVAGFADLAFDEAKRPGITWENATNVSEQPAQYHIEVSSEFLTSKLCAANNEPMEGRLTPFLRAFQDMGEKGYREFGERVQAFTAMSRDEWGRVRRANELWAGRKLSLLAKDIHDILPPAQFPMNSEFECARGVRVLTVMFLDPVRDMKTVLDVGKLVGRCTQQATREQILAFFDLAQDFERRGVLAKFDQRLLALTDAFVERFKFLVPAFGLRFYRDAADLDLSRDGTTTAAFEDLKQFFVDGFELAADLQLLTTAWNNVVHRSDFTQMVPRRKDVKTLADFEAKKKGERVKFLEANETFDWILAPAGDAHQLRNAIAHSAYKYEGHSQLIGYFPRGDDGSTAPEQMFLVEFAFRSLQLFEAVQLGAELVMATRRLLFFADQAKAP